MIKIKLIGKHPKEGWPFQVFDKKGKKIEGEVIWVRKDNFTEFKDLPKGFKAVEKWFIVEEVKKVVKPVKVEPKVIEPVKVATPKRTRRKR